MDINRIGLTIYRSKLVIEGNCEIKVIEIINISDGCHIPFWDQGQECEMQYFSFWDHRQEYE